MARAKDDLDARRRSRRRCTRRSSPPGRRRRGARRRGELPQAGRPLAMATFESGNLDQFNALLASGSPQDFLDQMSALEIALLRLPDRARRSCTAVVDRTAAARRPTPTPPSPARRPPPTQAAAGRAGARRPQAGRRRRASTRPSSCSPGSARSSAASRNGPDVERPGRPGHRHRGRASGAAGRRDPARQALPVRRRRPGQLRLLRPDVVGVQAGRRHAARGRSTPAGAASGRPSSVGRPAARRPGLLLHTRSATSASTPATAR